MFWDLGLIMMKFILQNGQKAGKRANFYVASQNKAFTYLYRRMFENDGEDRIERMRSTGVIILEGMTIE